MTETPAERVTRRGFLGTAGAAGAWLTWVLAGNSVHPAWAAPSFSEYPFKLGVASGDPQPDGVVLWTRLAPDPLAEDGHGGMPDLVVSVSWEVAEDEEFQTVVAAGTEQATPELGHSVHAEVGGLRPERRYYYRFRVGAEVSPVGRTRTAPAADAEPSALRFAVAVCQHVPHGYFTAYKHMVKQDLDFVVFLGDYIYEGPAAGSIGRPHVPPVEVHKLDGYRIRYGQYRLDPDLQAAHVRFPWLGVWSDHELDSDYADEVPVNDDPSQGNDTTEHFLQRRAAAYQAYYEFMPLRRRSVPDGFDLQLYRRIEWGQLATFHMLDCRQYKDDQACGVRGDSYAADCPEIFAESRSILGFEQEDWLIDGFGQSTARWDFLGQEVPFVRRYVQRDSGLTTNKGYWDGYRASQRRITQGWLDASVRNPIVLSGEVHAHWAADLKLDYDNPTAEIVGSELISTSITTGGDGADWTTPHPIFGDNSWLRFYTDLRGYVTVTVTPERMRADFECLPHVSAPDAAVFTRRSFVVDDGVRGLKPIFDQPLNGIQIEQVLAPTMLAGRANTVSLSLRNSTTASVDVVAGLRVPEGWTSTASATETIAPGEVSAVDVQVTPPGGLTPLVEDLGMEVTTPEGVLVYGGLSDIHAVVVPPGDQVALALDSGGAETPLLPAYQRLAPKDAWDPARGYGWVGDPPGYRDRGTFAVLERDFTLARNEPLRTLRLAVPPGRHLVHVLTGDSSFDVGNTIISVNGEQIAESGDRTIAQGTFEWFSFELDGGTAGRTVDLQLTVDLKPFWRLNGLIMVPAPGVRVLLETRHRNSCAT